MKKQTKLKEILRERNITAYRLAKDCKINQTIVYNCLNGKQHIYPKWKKIISEYLALPEEEIFINEEEDC